MICLKHAAPNPEFVPMYRTGIPTSKIAALEVGAEPTVRYHLQVLRVQSLPSGTSTKQPCHFQSDECLRWPAKSGRCHRRDHPRRQYGRRIGIRDVGAGFSEADVKVLDAVLWQGNHSCRLLSRGKR